MSKTIFLVTADQYELPVYVADSWGELARVTGISKSALFMAYKENRTLFKKYKIEVYNFY